MSTIKDFVRDWKFICTTSGDYPVEGILRIAYSEGSAGAVDLTWSNPKGSQELRKISFEELAPGHGWLNGKSGDGYGVTVTIINKEKTKIAGVVTPGDGLPEAGTWGADANGGREEES